VQEAAEEAVQVGQQVQEEQEGQEAGAGELLATLVGKAGMVRKAGTGRLLQMVEMVARVRAVGVEVARLIFMCSGVCRYAER
jgi:hypothetical protein